MMHIEFKPTWIDKGKHSLHYLAATIVSLLCSLLICTQRSCAIEFTTMAPVVAAAARLAIAATVAAVPAVVVRKQPALSSYG
jgi:hypothetical protein